MRKISARAAAFVLVAGLTVGMLAGCGKSSSTVQLNSETEKPQIQQTKEHVLSVASGKLTGKFSGFFPKTQGDRQVSELISVKLLNKDRAGDYVLRGIKGEDRSWNGKTYHYSGIADCSVKKRKDGKVNYTFELRKNLVFSDGKPLNADDLIFSLYAYLDAAYDGEVKVGELPIAGLAKYRGKTKPMYKLLLDRGKDDKTYDVYTKKTQKSFFQKDWPKAQMKLIDSIMKHYKTKSVAKAMVALDYANKDESGRVNSNYTFQHWSMKGDDKPEKKDFLRELQFTSSLDIVSENLVKNGIVEKGIYELLPEIYQTTIQIGNTSAKYITGIKKKGNYTVQVILSKNDPEALAKLAIPLQALHYYGDTGKYNYKKHKFGFQKGNLTAIKEKEKKPLGAGPYVFESYKDNAVLLKANKSYYKGEAACAGLKITAMNEEDMAYEIMEKAVDIAEPSITKSDVLQLRKANDNGTISGDMITTELKNHASYGYIGMNGAKVCVGNDPLSEASVNLRKGLAVALSYYRYASIHNYYGDTAELNDYSIGRDSWASPQSWDAGYSKAYNTGVNGRRIWTTRMTKEERTEAVRRAVLEYFRRAGYVVEKGKISQVPPGAPKSLTVLITGYGQKDHPSYALLKNAAKLLKTLGFVLKIKDEGDSGEMFTKVQSGNAQMWCAAWPTGDDPDTYMYSLYHSKGGSAYMYGIQSKKLDAMIMRAQKETKSAKRKHEYLKCLEYIRSVAVEIPVYQRKDCTLFGTARLKLASLPENATVHYNWRDEIEKIQVAG